MTPSFGFVQSFILLTDHYILGRAAFIFIMLLNVGVLLAFRFLRVPSGRGELSHHHNSILILGNFSAMNRCQNLLELWEETRYTIKNMQAYMSIYHVNKDLHCHIGKSNYLNKNNCSFLKKNIFSLSIMSRIDLSSMYVAPSGQYNGHLLLLSAAVQPVYSLRWDICFVLFLLCLVLEAEHASTLKVVL